MRKQWQWIAILLLLILTACDSKSKVERLVTSAYANGQPERVKLFAVIDGEKVLVGEERYYLNGNLQRSRELKDGYPHGLWREWYKNGQLKVEKQYVQGNLDGLQRGWYQDGSPRYEAKFSDGELLYRKEWNADGTLRHE